jgi:hypothetical protein
MPDELLPATFLFRYSVPCRYRAEGWSKSGLDLGEEFRLPSFAALDGGPEGHDVRAAWNESGLMFSVLVGGKRQPPWCRENRLDESDGLNLWIDTRDTHNIHRAGRFCHHFLFMPSGGGHRLNEATGAMLAINRAREAARPVRGETLGARSQKRPDGYLLDAFVPATALTGFDPAEHPRLGFMYALVDRELGTRTFCSAPEFPYSEDPSLWATLELAKQ